MAEPDPTAASASTLQPQNKKKRGAPPADGHPLETPWTVWYSKKTTENANTKNKQWLQHLKQLGTFATIETFQRSAINL